ncbi:glycosyltransferase [Solibacillus sp. FSL W7-1472]|uniref:cytidylyltransferase domain-containing protein n=1 Tax=Solibacillus sp. FSL W7-1472 TaxID=2921707 RepID=UPI0030D81BCE
MYRSKILVIIPARGGSKGIPKKNIRLLNGKPLINYTIEATKNSEFNIDILVTTDDLEIAYIAKKNNVNVIKRQDYLATSEITLDPVIFNAVNQWEKQSGEEYNVVITIQPTSPLLTSKTLDAAIKEFYLKNYDTLISGVNNPHLSWTKDSGCFKPLYTERKNRQYLPSHYVETGAFVITKREFIENDNRFGNYVSIYEIPENESIDIDTAQDWWIAEKELKKKRILFIVEGFEEIGLGHIYRTLSLAYKFIDHEIIFAVSKRSNLGISKISNSNFTYFIFESENCIFDIIRTENIDIVINDWLDTDKTYIKKLKRFNVKIVNFEDLGTGIEFADVVINDLYGKSNNLTNVYWGSKYFCARDEFLLAEPSNFNEEVKEVLVMFGGTDPSNLTKKVLDAVKLLNNLSIHFTFILGFGYKEKQKIIEDVEKNNLNVSVVCDVKHMTEYMQKADLAISSQGRTMYELAIMQVPTILLAQHERETLHSFGELKNGFINLGIGKEISITTIEGTVRWLINSPQIRLQMKTKMGDLNLTQGMDNVMELIFKDIG